jgi:hypothetical protein
MQHGHIAIPKSGRRDRMEENIKVFDFELSPRRWHRSTLSTEERADVSAPTLIPMKASDLRPSPRRGAHLDKDALCLWRQPFSTHPHWDHPVE